METTLWTEKYRPQLLNDIIGQEHVVERLKAWLKEGSVPNMLFTGRAGVGKTTTALCVARELYGKRWQENFLELNASDERGIDVVRGRIKDFARTKAIGADFKIIFLDECDSLTSEAQQALRRTMERYSKVARFILSCNYSSRLIEPIQSRTAVFRFRSLKKDEGVAYIKHIAEHEGLTIADEAYDALYELSEGDLRKATNLLQAAGTTGTVTKETVYDVASLAKPEDVKNMVELALAGNFTDARKKLTDLIINQGFSGEDIIKEIHRTVFDLHLPDTTTVKLIQLLGTYEFRLNQGGSDDIQLAALLAQLTLLTTKKS